MRPAPPRYFPVGAKPLRMAPSLARFGTDYGQGALDQLYFQVDDRYEEFVALKSRAPSSVRFFSGADDGADQARREALAWMRATWAREHPERPLPPERGDLAEDFAGFAGVVQEDFALLGAGEDGRGKTLLVDVCFPSGWRPERLVEADFATIHGPVPEFPESDRASSAMVRAMVERGPFVRFVWTVSPVADLDQHPDRLDRAAAWRTTRSLWLRVERQLTIPLPASRSGLFLIRVHMTPVRQLDETQQAALRSAIELMPPDVRAYKGLPEVQTFDRILSAASR